MHVRGLFNYGDKALKNRLVFLRLTRLTRGSRDDYPSGSLGMYQITHSKDGQSFS